MALNLRFNSTIRWHKEKQRWVATCEVCFDLHIKPGYSAECLEDKDARAAMQEHMKTVHGVTSVFITMQAQGSERAW